MNKIFFGFLIMAVLGGSAFYLTQKKSTNVLKNKNSLVTKEEKLAPETGKLSLEEEEMKEVASLTELEKEYEDDSIAEIKSAIAKNDEWAIEMKFVARANANELDDKSREEFKKYMRLNAVLYNILIERELDEGEVL